MVKFYKHSYWSLNSNKLGVKLRTGGEEERIEVKLFLLQMLILKRDELSRLIFLSKKIVTAL